MIVMKETGTGYRAGEFPLAEWLIAIFLVIALPATALSGLWGSPVRDVCAPLAALATALLAGSVYSLLSSWRRKRWVELDYSGGTVRWGGGASTPHETTVARFDVDRLPDGGPYRLIAVRVDGEAVGLQPQWESWYPSGLMALARRFNELTRD